MFDWLATAFHAALAFLKAIACVLLDIGCYIVFGLIAALNAVVAALGALIGVVIAVLPGMPSLPAVPAQFTTAYSWVAWVFPVGTLVNIFAFIVTVWVAWQAVAIALRWAKASAA